MFLDWGLIVQKVAAICPKDGDFLFRKWGLFVRGANGLTFEILKRSFERARGRPLNAIPFRLLSLETKKPMLFLLKYIHNSCFRHQSHIFP